MPATVSILGNTGTGVTLAQTPQGTPVATFSIASNSIRNSVQGKEKRTDWFNVMAYGKLAEALAENVRKGTHLLVRGSLTFSPWLTYDNEPRVSANIVLQDFELASWGSRENEYPAVDEPSIDSLSSVINN